MSHTTRLDLSYSKLGLREPFIAAVMTRVKREVTEAIPTAATNGTVVKYNPQFMDKWNDEQLFGLTLHESLHVVLMHMWRRDGRDPSLWNYANDAIINAYIKSRGYQLPDGGVHLSWVTESMSSEEVYERLKKEQQQQSGKGGKGGKGGGSGDDDGKSPAGGFDGSGDLEDAVDEATKTDMEATIVAADVRYCVAMGLATRLSADNFDKAWKFLEQMPGDIQTLTIKLAYKRDKSLTRSAAYTKWAVANASAFSRG